VNKEKKFEIRGTKLETNTSDPKIQDARCRIQDIRYKETIVHYESCIVFV